MKNKINIHVRKLLIERKDDVGIYAMKNYHSSTILFISRKVKNRLQWRASTLEIFPTPLPYGESLFIQSHIPDASPWNQTWTVYSHYQTNN